eukprot:s1452_g5.t1
MSPITEVHEPIVTPGDYEPESPVERPFGHGVLGSRSATFTRDCETSENESESRVSRASREVFDEVTGVWMPAVAEETSEQETCEHAEHEHAEHGSQAVETVGNVMMVMTDGDKPMVERLSCLAQRLQDLRDRIAQSGHEHRLQVMSSGNSDGSTTPRMAMRWNASARAAEAEQGSQVALMQEVRTAPELHSQGSVPWREPRCGPGTSPCGSCPDGIGPAVCQGQHEREDLQRQAHGDPWTWTGSLWWSRKDISDDQGRRTPWQVPHGGHQHDRTGHGIDYSNDTNDNSARAEQPGGVQPRAKGVSVTDTESRGESKGQGWPACEKGACGKDCGCGDAGGAVCNTVNTDATISGGECSRGSGRCSDGDLIGRRGGLKALWQSLMDLRGRMSSGDEAPDNSQPRLEAEHGNQSYNIQYDNTDNYPLEYDDTTINDFKHGTGDEPTKSTTINSSPEDDEVTFESLETAPNVTKKMVRPVLAKRLAKAAALTSVLMQPVKELFSMVNQQVDVMEIACSPTSELSSSFETAGYTTLRVNYNNGFDLDTKQGTSLLKATIDEQNPKLAWVSMKCTRLSSLQNLTPRSPEQWDNFLKRRGQDLRRNEEVVDSLDTILSSGGDVAWEWPSSAHAGWSSKAIKKLLKKMHFYKRGVFWARFDGCCYGLQWRGIPLRKGWTVLTTNRELWMSLCKRCDGSHEHAECRGEAAQASAYYPPAMCKAVVKAFEHAWNSDIHSLEKLTEKMLLKYEDTEHHPTSSRTLTSSPTMSTSRSMTSGDDGPMVMALSRKKLALETAPTGKKLEEIKQTMLRVHRAAGHTGMSSLVQLLRAKGAPGWALEVAQNLKCPECIEASKPRLHPPASTGEEPKIFEYLGTDVFEYEEPSDKTPEEKIKHKMIIYRDRASGLTMFSHLKTYTNAWEPTTSDVVATLSDWLATYPAPKWVVADSARYYTSQEMQDFVNRSGIGLTIVSAEARALDDGF